MINILNVAQVLKLKISTDEGTTNTGNIDGKDDEASIGAYRACGRSGVFIMNTSSCSILSFCVMF